MRLYRNHMERDLSAGEWAKIETLFVRNFGEVKLVADGCFVVFRREIKGPDHGKVMAYPGRIIPGDHSSCPLPWKFFRQRYTQRDRFSTIRMWRGRYRSYGSIFTPWWCSYTSLRAHLKRHCKSLELVSSFDVVV